MATPLQFGRISVAALLDGYLDMELAGFFPGRPMELFDGYPGWRIGTKLRLPLTTYVIRAAGRVILVDTGIGGYMGRFEGVAGMLPAALQADGIQPEDVDTVLFTHLHPDHVGWNCTEQEGSYLPTFPNARYVVNRAEWEHWSDVPAGYVRRHLLPLRESGQLELVTDGHEPAAGVQLLSTPGHTPGHVSILVYNGGEGGIITGDATHHPIEVEYPEWSPSADEDPVLSVRSRQSLIDRVEVAGLLLLGGHFPPPHAGRVLRVGQRRVYRALNG